MKPKQILCSPLRLAAAFSMALVYSGGVAGQTLALGEERVLALESQQAEDMIAAIKEISLARADSGLLKRFNQSKTLACYDASFTVKSDLPESLRQGIFAQQKTYPAQLRFANATQDDDREKDFRGLSIKLQGVDGTPLWGKRGEQDFLFNSYPVLFAANPSDFLDFINATRDRSLWRYFLNPAHFYSLKIVLNGRQEISNPLAIDYWSTTPYRFGNDPSVAVKYALRPCDVAMPEVRVVDHRDFLAAAMQDHLQQQAACFNFMVQFQLDAKTMPIEDASILWSEQKSAFISIATLQIAGDQTSAQTRNNCESMTFNPWQSLAAHRPLGGINRTRLPVYSEIGKFRGEENKNR